MALEFLIASSSDFEFDPPALVDAARQRWTDARVVRPTGARGELVEAEYYLTTNDVRAIEVTFYRAGDSIGIVSSEPSEAAEVAAWVAQTAPVPDDGSVVLIHWLSDFVPLTPGTTVDALLQMRG